MRHYIQSYTAEEINDFVGITKISCSTTAQQQQLIAQMEYLRRGLM